MTRNKSLFVPWAGLASGPTAWAISTQLNYTLAPWGCAHHNLVPIAGTMLAAMALGGGLLSWRARGGNARSSTFLATMSAAMAILFTAVILTQAFAGLIFTGCEQ